VAKDERIRVMLTVPWPLMESIAEYADALDKPVATSIVDLLKELQPQIDGLAKLVRHAREGNKAAAKRTLQHMIGDSMAEILGQQLELPSVGAKRARVAVKGKRK
jgi:hypothetical protein